MNNPKEFKAKYKTINGKKVLVIETINETVIRKDGSKHVIIHAPKLDLINKYLTKEKQGG